MPPHPLENTHLDPSDHTHYDILGMFERNQLGINMESPLAEYYRTMFAVRPENETQSPEIVEGHHTHQVHPVITQKQQDVCALSFLTWIHRTPRLCVWPAV